MVDLGAIVEASLRIMLKKDPVRNFVDLNFERLVDYQFITAECLKNFVHNVESGVKFVSNFIAQELEGLMDCEGFRYMAYFIGFVA